MNGACDRVEPKPSLHGQRVFTDHIARMGRYDGGPDNGIGSFLDVHSGKAFFFPIQNCPIYFVQRKGEGVDQDALGFRFLFIQTDMGNFRLGISRPGNDKIFRAGIAQAERMRK